MNFYVMYAETAEEKYVEPGDALHMLKKGCAESAFQYLDDSPMTAEISLNGGLEFPDFLIYERCIPLVSRKFLDLLDRLGVDNLFEKRITLTYSRLGLAENYWLALPPRIQCLDMQRSVIDEKHEAKKIAINLEKIGRYKVFKLAETVNHDIIVTEEVMQGIQAGGLSNVYFREIQ